MATPEVLASAARGFLKPGRRWVVFEHGTVVVVTDPSVADPADYARLKLEHDATEPPGSYAGDFSVLSLDDRSGWIVASHDPDVFTVVPRIEVDEGAQETTIGLAGRTALGADRDGLNVVHVGGR